MDQPISHLQSNVNDYKLPWIGNPRKGDITRYSQVFSRHLPEEWKFRDVLEEVRGITFIQDPALLSGVGGVGGCCDMQLDLQPGDNRIAC